MGFGGITTCSLELQANVYLCRQICFVLSLAHLHHFCLLMLTVQCSLSNLKDRGMHLCALIVSTCSLLVLGRSYTDSHTSTALLLGLLDTLVSI